MAVISAAHYIVKWRRTGDDDCFFIALTRLGSMLGSTFILLSILPHFGHKHLTWRTPMALAVFSLVLSGIAGVRFDSIAAHGVIRRWIRKRHEGR